MVKARKFVVTKRFDGLPRRDNFELVEVELPPLKNGEVLVKVNWISVDSYVFEMRGFFTVPYDQIGSQVGTVQESKNADYPVGTILVSHKGWCDYYIVDFNGKFSHIIDKPYKLPNLGYVPLSMAVGAAGMHGLTAYFGLLEVCNPKPGQTIAVTGASGSIGSIVGQIAKIKGCKVIGFAGTDEKANWLEKELGFDKVINYKSDDVITALKEAAPDGIDSFFDNAGGELSSKIMYSMNLHGKVCICGSVIYPLEEYNKVPKVTAIQPPIFAKQLTVIGYDMVNYYDKIIEATEALICWLEKGQIKFKEHNIEGLENTVDLFLDIFKGKTNGRPAVKL